MPLPEPNTGEDRQAFISRCMGDATMKSEQPDGPKRLAVCIRQASSEMSDEDMAALLATLSETEWAEMADAVTEILENDAHGDHKKKLKKQTDDDPNAKNFAQTLDDVEIFRTGIWNGDKYTVKDLDDMVAAFEPVGFQPPVKLGHDTKSGDPAYGWVTSIRRAGDRLVARFENIPDELFKMIKERRFNAVSSEIFWNLKRNGQKFRRVLKAVAILGADVPAVSSLKPLAGSVSFGDVGAAALHTYQVGRKRRSSPMPKNHTELKALRDELRAKLKDEQDESVIAELTTKIDEVVDQIVELADENKGDGDKPGEDAVKIQRLTEQLTTMHTELEDAREDRRHEKIGAKVKDLRIPSLRPHVEALYDLATREGTGKVKFFTVDDKGDRKDADVDAISVVDDLVDRLNESTKSLFAELGTSGTLKRDDEPISDEGVGIIVDQKTKEHMAKHDTKDYSAAMELVLDADPELRTKYAKS